MRIAVLTDIHSNWHALSACIEKAKALGAERFIFLGDYTSDCALPVECMDAMHALEREVPCTFIRGNRDDAQIDCRKNGCKWEWGSQGGSLRYTYEALRESDLDWLESISGPMTLALPGCAPLILCHGSPEAQRELLFPYGGATIKWASRIDGTMLCGHSHKPFIHRQGNAQIVNCGTVGVPCVGDVRAIFGLIDSDGDRGWRAQLVPAEYDIEGAVEAIRQSGLLEKAPWWARSVIAELRTGRSYSMACLLLAMRYARLEGVPLSEVHWQAAGAKLGLW